MEVDGRGLSPFLVLVPTTCVFYPGAAAAAVVCFVLLAIYCCCTAVMVVVSLSEMLSVSSLLGLWAVTAAVSVNEVAGSASAASPPPRVTVKNGSYVGSYSAGYQQDFFLGMPYAQVRLGSTTLFPNLW